MLEYLGRGREEKRRGELIKKHAMENQMWDREVSLSYFLPFSIPPVQHTVYACMCFWQSKATTGPRWGIWAFHWHSLSNAHSLNPSASFFCFSTLCKISFWEAQVEEQVRPVVGHCDTLNLLTQRDEAFALHWLTSFCTNLSECG